MPNISKNIVKLLMVLALFCSEYINTAQAAIKESSLTPMSDAAMQGAGCLALATPVMAAAYAVGPTEIMMLVTGAVIVPSSSAQLLISLGGILGAAACGVGSVITPNVVWMFETLQQPAASTQNEATSSNLQPVAIIEKTGLAVAEEPVNEDLVQGLGCLAGVIGISAITLASAPVEIVGLSAGGVTVPTNSSILFLGMAGTVVPAGCSIGAAISLPMLVLSRNLRLDAVGQAITSLFDWNQPQPQLHNNKALYMEASTVSIKPSGT